MLLKDKTSCQVKSCESVFGIWNGVHMSKCTVIRNNLLSYLRSAITSDINVLLLWRTSYWSIEDETYKTFEKKIPLGMFLEEKKFQKKQASMPTHPTL